MTQHVPPHTVALAPDDLDLLQKFLDAWCEEHDVAPTDREAVDVASALINWYQSPDSNRELLKGETAISSPTPLWMRALLRRIRDIDAVSK